LDSLEAQVQELATHKQLHMRGMVVYSLVVVLCYLQAAVRQVTAA
jgi:hypothetical protein